MKIYFDGGCRPNPGAMEAAVVAGGKTYLWSDLGHGSSGEAEWIALLRALDIARQLARDDIELLGDSVFVIDQANGRARCRSPRLQRHLDAFRAGSGGFCRLRVRHIRRNQNLAGIALQKARWFPA